MSMNKVEQLQKLIKVSERMMQRCEHDFERENEQAMQDNLYLLLEKAEANRLIYQQRLAAAQLKKKK